MGQVVLNIGWARAASTAFRLNFLARHPDVLAVDRNQPAADGPGARILQQLKTASEGDFAGEAAGLQADWGAYARDHQDRLVCLSDEELSIGIPGRSSPAAIAARCGVLFPGARTLAVVRGQVESVRSFYVLSQREGLGPKAPFAEWVERFFLAPPPGRGFAYLFTHAATLSAYRAWQLPEDIFVLPYDQLKSDPAAAYLAVARWLGVSEAACEALSNHRINESSREIPQDRPGPAYTPDLEAAVRGLFEDDNHRLADEFGVVLAT